MRVFAIGVLLLAACGGAPDALPAPSGGKGDAPEAVLPRALRVPLHLAHGAVAAGPDDPANALAYLPAGLRMGDAIDVVVHLHGFYNCVETALGDEDAPCVRGGGARAAHHLASQLDRSGKNAILILPEVTPRARSQASADVGALAAPGALAGFLDEARAALAPTIGAVAQGRVIVSAHSGGFRGAAAFAVGGGVALDELWLFDGLYDLADRFEDWIAAEPTRRYVDLYTRDGGTLSESQAQAARLAAALPEGALVDDRGPAPVTDAQLAHAAVVKRVAEDHDGVLRTGFERLLVTSRLDPR